MGKIFCSNRKCVRMENRVQNYEKISINAIPAREVVYYHGWIIQLDKGYKDRANCVYPLYPSDLTKEEMVNYCENLYTRACIEPRFKLTKTSYPSDLDSYLDSLGYMRYSETSFQTLDMSKLTKSSLSDDFHYSRVMTDEWFDYCVLWNQIPQKKVSIVSDIWNRITIDTYFCHLVQYDSIVCVGFIAQLQDFCGVYAVTVDPDKRHNGHGTQFMKELLLFASNRGVKTCYLQVETSNSPALGLYDNLGFKEQYQYWYRKKLTKD